MRFIISHLNLLFLICWFPLRRAQEIDSVWFPANNFTNCYKGAFQVYSVNRYFDVEKSMYSLNFTSSSDINVTNLNEQGTTFSSSKMILKFGFKTMEPQSQKFCPDSIDGCPLLPKTNFTIERSFNLSNIPVYPLADITAQYSAITADYIHLVCIQLAPVGYQHPTWRNIFTWLPISFTVSAAIISLIASFTIFYDDDAAEHNIFLFGSNYAMSPGVLRLKTPGFFDLIFYSQFIVTVGQFNIDYPRFHALFTSNFSWSFLLFNDSTWLHGVIASLFSSSSTTNSITSVPGYSINKRQEIYKAASDTSKVNVAGTGMSDFAIANGIDINVLFFTLMVYMLIIIASCVVICFLVWLVLFTVEKTTTRLSLIKKSNNMWNFTLGVLVRILSLAYLPILTMSFYQLMIPSYWYITVAASISLVVPFLFYGFISIKLLQIRPASFIYTELNLLLRYGTLYNAFTDITFHFFIWIIVYKSVVASMIGLFQTSGLAQVILVLLAEVLLMAGLLIKLPFADNQVNLFHTVIGFIRIIVLSLNIAYLPTVKATALVKQYVGYAQMAFHCLAFFIMLVLQIKNLVTIATGLGDDELDETGKPPARMTLWRKTKRPLHQLHVNSTATLMTTASKSRSQNASFYMGGNNSNRNSNRLTTDSQTLDVFASYYGQNSSTATSHAVLKPDEVTRLQNFGIETVNATNENMLLQYPLLVADYMNNSATASSSSMPLKPNEQNPSGKSTRVYKIDDEIVPSSEPLIASAFKENSASAPPPLPKHVILNNDSTYSPPHQPSLTSLVMQDNV